MRKKIFNHLGPMLISALMISGEVLSQGMPPIPAVPSSMLSQFSTMSPDQRRELAAQYGINLEDLGMDGRIVDDLGTDGQELASEANQVLYERIIEAQDYIEKAEEYRRDNIPLFEQDYSEIEELPIYGQFIFDGEFSTFAPVNNASVLAFKSFPLHR